MCEHMAYHIKHAFNSIFKSRQPNGLYILVFPSFASVQRLVALYYQSPLILTELFQHNLINVSYLKACYLYQVMMTLHFLNDVAYDTESTQKSKITINSASLAMSTSVLKALPGKLGIKRHSPSILYLFGNLIPEHLGQV